MKRQFISFVKQVASPLLEATGLLDRQISALVDQPGRLLVVMYHRVIADPALDPFALGMCVRQEHFDEQIDYLQARFNVLPLSEAVRRSMAGETLPPASVAITFDDGYLDNLEVAAPMLLQRGLPATFFVATGGLSGGRALWWDRAIAALADSRADEVTLPMLGFEAPLSLQAGQKSYTVAAVLNALWTVPPAELDAIVDAVVEALTPGETYRCASTARAPRMTTRQVARLRQMGFEIGAHTERHVDMRHLDPAERQPELILPREQLEAIVNTPVSGFAYPSGFHDETLQALVEQAGFDYAVSTDRGLNSGQLRRFALYRVGMPDTPLADFKRALCSVPLVEAGAV